MDRREFLYQRRNRCVGRIMSGLERTVFDNLSEYERKAVRSLVRTNIAQYHQDALDAIEMEHGTLINALAVKAKDDISGGRDHHQHRG